MSDVLLVPFFFFFKLNPNGLLIENKLEKEGKNMGKLEQMEL